MLMVHGHSLPPTQLPTAQPRVDMALGPIHERLLNPR